MNDMLDSVQQKTEFYFVSVDSFFRFDEAEPVMFLLQIPAWALTTCFKAPPPTSGMDLGSLQTNRAQIFSGDGDWSIS